MNKCAIKIGISRWGKHAADSPPSGEVFHLSFQNQDVEKHLFAGPFYNFERSLFQMKAAKTRVILDART
jgi:hypothetical protein